MQFSPDLRNDVAAGRITMTVRLWQRPQVRVGGRYSVAGVTIEVTSIELVPFAAITAADVRRGGGGWPELIFAPLRRCCRRP